MLHAAKVPAGLTAMQGLERVAKVGTRYGGRYVRSVDGVEEHGRRAWFYYVNGYLADRSAAEYRLRAGDVEWWDFRSWRDPAQDPVVIGSFPEPFLHGYDGHRRRTLVAYQPGARRAAQAIARVVHGRVAPLAPGLPSDVNEVLVHPAVGRSGIAIGRGPTAPVLLSVTPRDALRLARDPALVRFRYQGLP